MADVPNPVFDINGDPFSGAVLKAFLPGGTTALSIAIDENGGSPQASITYNAEGKLEVSGNEILPYIDRKHKWGIFANATDAAANTPFYMGPFDNVPRPLDDDSINALTLADAVADTGAFEGKIVQITDRGDGQFEYKTGQTPNTFNIVAADATGLDLVLRVTERLLSTQWGSVASTTVDSSLVIQAMAGFSTPGIGQTIVIEGNVLFDTKPIIPAGVSVECTGFITSDAPATDTSLGIGDKDVFTAFIGIKYDISMVRKTESDFSNIDNIGVLFENIIGADITLRAMRGFTTNAVGRGNTSTAATDQGFAWNTIELGDMENMLVGFDFRKLSGGGGIAFANQNEVFQHGRNHQRNAVATSGTTVAAFVDGSVINAYVIKGEGINGNHFYNQPLEFGFTRSSDGQVFNGTGFLLNDSVNNRSTDARFENAFAVAKLTGDCRDNFFSTLFSDTSNAPILIDESVERSNNLVVQDQLMIQPIGASWDSGPLAQMTQQYSTGKICTVGASWTFTSGGNEPTIEAFDSTIQALPDGLLLGSGRGITWRLETQTNKRFVIRRMYKEGSKGRLLISARKADGTQWTDADVDSPYIHSGSGLIFSGATFAGWREVVDSSSDLFFSAIDDVDHVLIQFTQGVMQRAQIQCLDQGSPVVTSGFIGFNTTQRMTKISPVDGFWTKGEEAVNFDATAAQPIHWKAEANGWANGTTWVITTAYVINDIRFNGTDVYICRIAGTSAGAGGPSGTGQGIVDGTVTWDFVGARVTFRPGPAMP